VGALELRNEIYRVLFMFADRSHLYEDFKAAQRIGQDREESESDDLRSLKRTLEVLEI
jgi:hypothetical protein